MYNGGFHTDEEMIDDALPNAKVRVVRLWYENTKMWQIVLVEKKN